MHAYIFFVVIFARLTFKKCKLIYGLYCVVCGSKREREGLNIFQPSSLYNNKNKIYISAQSWIIMTRSEFLRLTNKKPWTQWHQNIFTALTQVFSLQSFPLPLLGIHQGIFGDHLDKQLLKEWHKFRNMQTLVLRELSKNIKCIFLTK